MITPLEISINFSECERNFKNHQETKIDDANPAPLIEFTRKNMSRTKSVADRLIIRE